MYFCDIQTTHYSESNASELFEIFRFTVILFLRNAIYNGFP